MLKVKKLSLRVVSQRVMAPTCQRKSSRAQRPSSGARISFGQGLWCRAAGGGDPVTPSPTHRHTQIPDPRQLPQRVPADCYPTHRGPGFQSAVPPGHPPSESLTTVVSSAPEQLPRALSFPVLGCVLRNHALCRPGNGK